MITIINLTSDNIRLCQGKLLPPSGMIARAEMPPGEGLPWVNTIGAFAPGYGRIVGIPAPVDGTAYIVPVLIRCHPYIYKSRKDCYSPCEISVLLD